MWFDLFHKEKKLGLALGGGATRGFAHLGLLKYIDELGLKVSFLSGTSAGALVAVLYACGLSARQIEEKFGNYDWGKLLKPSFSLKGFSNNERISSIIPKGFQRFSDLHIPLTVVCADVLSGKKVLLNSGELGSAIAATTAVPGIYTPVEREGQILIDGMTVSNVPIAEVRAAGANLVIAGNVIPLQGPKESLSGVHIYLRSQDILQNSQLEYKKAQADIFIQLVPRYMPIIQMYHSMNEELIDMGYQEAKKALHNHKILLSQCRR